MKRPCRGLAECSFHLGIGLVLNLIWAKFALPIAQVVKSNGLLTSPLGIIPLRPGLSVPWLDVSRLYLFRTVSAACDNCSSRLRTMGSLGPTWGLSGCRLISTCTSSVPTGTANLAARSFAPCIAPSMILPKSCSSVWRMEAIAFYSSMNRSCFSTSIASSHSHEHSSATIRSPVLGNAGPDRSGGEPRKLA